MAKTAPTREINQGEKDAEKWNQAYPEGTPVKVKYEGGIYSANTSSLASSLHGEAIIYVTCFRFPVPLSYLTPDKPVKAKKAPKIVAPKDPEPLPVPAVTIVPPEPDENVEILEPTKEPGKEETEIITKPVVKKKRKYTKRKKK